MDGKKLFTSKEFREFTGISRPTEHRERRRGHLACFKIGTRVFYSEKHIEDYLSRCEQPAREESGAKRRARKAA